MNNKIKGSIYGFIIGDALGLPLKQLLTKDIKEKYNSMVDYYKPYNHLPLGVYSSESQLYIATLKGILYSIKKNNMQLNKNDIINCVLSYYKEWLSTQGNLIYNREPNPEVMLSISTMDLKKFKKSNNQDMSADNLFKTAPIGLLLNPMDSFILGMELTALTNGHPTSILIGGFVPCLLSYILKTNDFDYSLESSIDLLNRNYLGKDLSYSLQKNKLNTHNLTDDYITVLLGEGWDCKEALSLSLYFIIKYKEDFKKGVISAINTDCNSNSIGALIGTTLGLINDISNIPEELLINIQDFKLIEDYCNIITSTSKYIKKNNLRLT